MKTLTLLRHAKSAWDDTVPRDFDRPINARGRRAAQRIGEYIAANAMSFDQLRASPAVRVRETLALVADVVPLTANVVFDDRIYLASAVALLDLAHGLDDADTDVLLIGHNPGLEDLLLLLTPPGGALRAEAELKYPTATLATMSFAVDHWAQVDAGGGVLTRFVRPRDLDPTLGPDD